MTSRIAITAIVLLASGGAHANPFDDCVLDKMSGVTSDLAAKSIKVACLRKSSVDMPPWQVARLVGGAEYGDFGGKEGTGFWIHIENQSDFIVTEVTVKIEPPGADKPSFFRTDDFWRPTPGVIYTGPPPDPTVSMQIKPFAKVDYAIKTQANIDMKTQKFVWHIDGAKGIPIKPSALEK